MEKDLVTLTDSERVAREKRANRRDQPSAWGVLLLPLCCLLPLLLVSFGSWVASTSFEFSAPLVIGGAVAIAGLILWNARRARASPG